MPLKLLNWNVEWAAAKWKADERSISLVSPDC